jgi:hypothetical protein
VPKPINGTLSPVVENRRQKKGAVLFPIRDGEERSRLVLWPGSDVESEQRQTGCFEPGICAVRARTPGEMSLIDLEQAPSTAEKL